MIKTSNNKVLTTHEVAERFNELAQQEKWFDIQDELFAENVKSVEPPHSPYLKYAEGKIPVRKKGEDFVSKILELHGANTTTPVISNNHFAIGRCMDINTKDFGRIKIDEIIVYEVKDGQIVLEQFFY